MNQLGDQNISAGLLLYQSTGESVEFTSDDKHMLPSTSGSSTPPISFSHAPEAFFTHHSRAKETMDDLKDQLHDVRNATNLKRILVAHRFHLRPAHYRLALSQLIYIIQEGEVESAWDKQQVQSILELAVSGLRPYVAELSSQHLASIACSLAKIHYYDGPLIRGIMEASLKLSSFQPWHISGLLYAMGRFKVDFNLQIDPSWTALILSHLYKAKFDTCPSSFAQALYGCSLIGSPPDHTWLQASLTPLSTSQPHSGEKGVDRLSAIGTAGLILALSRLKFDPGRDWINIALHRIERDVRTVGNTSTSSELLGALASMHHTPNQRWMEHYLWHVQRMLPRTTLINLATIARSLAVLRYRPPRRWLTEYFRVFAQRVEGTKGKSASMSQYRINNSLQSRHHSTSGSIAAVLWSLAKLQTHSNLPSLKKVIAVTRPELSTMPPRYLSMIIWAMQKLRYQPPADWMRAAQKSILSRLGQFDSSSLSLVLIALGGFCDVSQLAGDIGNRSQIDSDLVIAICKRLHRSLLPPDDDQRKRASEKQGADRSSSSRLLIPPVRSLQMITSLLLATAKLQVEVPRDFRLILLQYMSSKLEDISLSQVCLMCWCICKVAHKHDDLTSLRGGSEHALLPRIESLTLTYLSRSYPAPQPNVIDLFQLISSFSLVAYKPTEGWMELHERHCCLLLHQGVLQPNLAFKMVKSFQRLEYRPSSLMNMLRSVVNGLRKRDEEEWREEALLSHPYSEVRDISEDEEDPEEIAMGGN